MMLPRLNTRWSVACAIAVLQLSHQALVSAQVETVAGEQSALARMLQSAAEDLEIEATDPPTDEILVRAAPLMTYSDPARDYSAAGVWRIGESGRPLGIVAIEFWPEGVDGRDFLSYELLSFLDGRLSFRSAAGVDVQLSENSLEMRELPDAAAPRSSKALRLIQMKRWAARFSVEETLAGEAYTLRGLPRPIDRYEDSSNNILDGAGFVFVYGTNPELLVLIECDAETWRYGLARLSSARLLVRLDGEQAADYPELKWPFPTRDYQSAGYNVNRPQETD